MNLLYIGIRCNDKDEDGSAWNHHKENLKYIFKQLNFKVNYIKLSDLKKKNYNAFLDLFYIFKQIFLRKRLIPFQELIYLFKFYSNCRNVNFREILIQKKIDIIFIESSRLTFILEEINNLIDTKEKLIICDMDDMLSRRYSIIRKNNNSISFGFETKNLYFLSKVINTYAIKHLFLKYEVRALINAESKLKQLCNSISLVSKKEAYYLKKSKGSNNAYIKNTYSFDPYFDVEKSYSFSNIERFIFIGSDRQLQNKSSIKNLLKIWSDENINIDLYIFGRIFNNYKTLSKRVFFKGYVSDLSQCYQKNSVLINLTEIEGGIKIKTIQAISRGIPVIGLHNAFDGLPLSIDLFKFKNISQVKSFLKSSKINNNLIKQHHIQNQIAREILTKKSVLSNWKSIFYIK